jgi:hypothetical protein
MRLNGCLKILMGSSLTVVVFALWLLFFGTRHLALGQHLSPDNPQYNHQVIWDTSDLVADKRVTDILELGIDEVGRVLCSWSLHAERASGPERASGAVPQARGSLELEMPSLPRKGAHRRLRIFGESR